MYTMGYGMWLGMGVGGSGERRKECFMRVFPV